MWLAENALGPRLYSKQLVVKSIDDSEISHSASASASYEKSLQLTL